MKTINSMASGWCRCLRVIALLVASSGLQAASPAYADTEKASSLYEDALRRFDKGDLSGTAIQLKNAIVQDNRMLSAHLLLGKTLFKLGQLKAAEATFEEALKLGVDRGEVILQLGQVYLLQGESKRVIDRIQPSGLPPAIQIDVLTLRGTAYADAGNFTMASRSFAEARLLDPKSAAPLIAEASLLLGNGRRDEAMVLSRKATEMAPGSALAWSTYASVLQADQNLSGALEAYDRSLVCDPRHAEARVSRAALLMSLHRNAEAQRDLAFLKEARLEDPRVLYLRAVLAGERGDTAGARTFLRDLTQRVDALPKGYLKGRGHLLMAGALGHHALRNWEKAAGYLNLLLERQNLNEVARKLLASTYIETGDYRRAKPLLENMLLAIPGDAQVQFMLGSVYLALQQYSEAADLLEKASRGGDPGAARELGLTYFPQLAELKLLQTER